MREKRGWWLPNDDGYFDKFIEDAGGYKQNGFQREHLLEAFKHVKNWNTAVDVGAHVGFWTRDMAEKFKTVWAFEAAPDTFKCLLKNTSDLYNVRADNVAIGHEEGHVQVYQDTKRARQSGSRWVKPLKRSPILSGQIKMITLDSIGISSCGLLKIDVEGFELFVLRGASDLIHSSRPVIIMEIERTKKFSEARYKSNWLEPVNFLLECGYVEVAHMRPDRIYVPRRR